MTSEADNHLIDRIRGNDADGWRQLVDRYQKRLLAFARARVGQHATAEDLVQETLVSFLQSISRFRQDAGLETFLFQILRRRIIDHYRARGETGSVSPCIPIDGLTNENPESLAIAQEREADQMERLAYTIREVTSKWKEARKFRELKIAEAVFFAGLKNRSLAEHLGCPAEEIAMVKHRTLQRMSAFFLQGRAADEAAASDLLTRAWAIERPSCPKRTTLGKFTLGILPDDWNDYVHFHAEVLGCTYCAANLVELRKLDEDFPSDANHDRLFQSTIGFLRHPPTRQ
ncbi:MAG: sigma-70 family RNA polymerase sigma factor [Planctomycetota bacterium]